VRALILLVSLTLLAVGAAGCGASAPEADFTATPVSGQAPVTVTFADTSKNEPTSWRWDFGDGETSTEQSPSHEYGLAGSYTVTLTTANDEGSDDIVKQALITVTPPPNPVCADVQELRATIGQLQELEISPDAIGQLQQIGSDAKAIIDRIRTDAAGEYADEVAALDEAYDSITAAIGALQDSPTGAIDDVITAITDGIAALDALESAVSEACG
jgi:PKD repeat protein